MNGPDSPEPRDPQPARRDPDECAGSIPRRGTRVMSQDIGMTLNLRRGSGSLVFGASAACPWAGSCGRVEGELAQELAGGGADDADVQVVHERQDAGSGVGPADATVVEFAAGAQGDGAGVADDVAADAVAGVGGPVAGGSLGPGRRHMW